MFWQLFCRAGPAAALEIVGPMDERDPALPAVMAALQRDDRIRMVGFQGDIASRLPTADLLLFTSRREGLQYPLENPPCECDHHAVRRP